MSIFGDFWGLNISYLTSFVSFNLNFLNKNLFAKPALSSSTYLLFSFSDFID